MPWPAHRSSRGSPAPSPAGPGSMRFFVSWTNRSLSTGTFTTAKPRNPKTCSANSSGRRELSSRANGRHSTSCRLCQRRPPRRPATSKRSKAAARRCSTRARPCRACARPRNTPSRLGGGSNHRHGLFDAILVKENHIKSAGGLANALKAAASANDDVLIEVEVESIAELKLALDAGADRILLDNFSLEDLRVAVAINGTYGYVAAELEASGNVGLDTLRGDRRHRRGLHLQRRTDQKRKGNRPLDAVQHRLTNPWPCSPAKRRYATARVTRLGSDTP